MPSEINNAKCAQYMLDNMEGIDFPNTRNAIYGWEWISVKDKLPSQNEWVLAFDGKNMCVCWMDLSSYDYLFMFGMSSSQQFKNVTHWMPLPKLPDKGST